MRTFRGGVGAAILLGVSAYAARAEASPTLSIASPVADAVVGNTVAVQAVVTDNIALVSVIVDIGGVTQALSPSGGSYVGTVNISALPAGTVALTVTASDALGGTASTTENVSHQIPVDPPPPPPSGPCAALNSGSPNLVVVNGVAGDVILDWDATRILYVASSGLAIKSRVDGTITMLSSDMPTQGRLFSTGATWSTGTWNAGMVTPHGSISSFVVGGDYETYIVGSTIYRVLLTTGATESIATSGVYGLPTIDASGTGYVTYTIPGSPVAYPLMGWPVGGAPAKISDQAKDASIWGAQVAWSKHWASALYPSSTLLPAAGQPQVILDAPPTGFVGPNGTTIKRSGFDYDVHNGWTAYTHVVGTQLQAWTRAPDGTTALASPYANVLLAGMNDQGDVVVDNYVGMGSTRSLSKANGALPTTPIELGGNRGRMQYIGGTWYEAVGCALFRVGAGSLDPGSGITPPPPPDAGVDAGGTDAGSSDDAGASEDGGPEVDASGGEDAGEGGSSSSSSSGASSSASSSSGSSEVGSPGTPASGGDDGGCATGGSSPAGIVSSGLVALAAAFLSFGRRRRRRA